MAARLEGQGQRVQRSVFTCNGTPAQMARLEARCRALLGPDDRFNAYLLRQRGCVQLPGIRVATLPDYWLC